MVKIILLLTYFLGFLIWNFSCDVQAVGSSISSATGSGPEIKNAASFPHHRIKRALTYLVPLDDADSSEEHHKIKRCWRARPLQKVSLSLYPEEMKRPGLMTGNNLNVLYENQKRSADRSWDSNEIRDDNMGNLKLVPLSNPRENLREFLNLKTPGVEDDSSSEESEEDILKRIKNHLKSDDYKVLALVGKRAGNYPANKHRKLICYCREANCSGGDCDRMMYRPCSICRNPRPGLSGNTKYYSNYGEDDYQSHKTRLDDERIPLNVRYPVKKNQFLDYYTSNDYFKSQKSQDLNTVDFRTSEKNRTNDGARVSYQTPLPLKSPMGVGFYDSNRPLIYRPIPANPMANPYPRWSINSYYPSIGKSGVIVPSYNQGIVRLHPPRPQNSQFFGVPQPELKTAKTGSYSTSNNKFYGGYDLGLNTPREMRPRVYPQHQNIHYYQRATQPSVTSTSLEDKEDYDTSTENSLGPTVTFDSNNYDTHGGEFAHDNPRVKGYTNIITDGGPLRGNLENVDYNGVSDEPRKYKLPVVFRDNVYSDEKSEVPKILDGSTTLRPQEFYHGEDEYQTPGTVGVKQTTDYEEKAMDWGQNIVGMTTQRIIQSGSDEDSRSDDWKTTTDSEDVEFVGHEEEYHHESTSEDYADIRVVTNGYFTSEEYVDFGKVDKEDGPTTEIEGNIDYAQSKEDDESNSVERKETQMESGISKENVAMKPDGDRIQNRPSIKPQNHDFRNSINTQVSKDDEIVSNIRENEVSSHDDTGINVMTSLHHNFSRDSEHLERSSESIESGETRMSNTSSRSMQTDEITESSENQELPSIEEVGNERADSEEYKSLTPEEEDIYTTYEEDDGEMPPSRPVDDVFQRLLEKHVDHFEGSAGIHSPCKGAPDLEEVFTEYPAAENNREAPPVDQEPGGIAIDNTATKYFSPNDRVLEYIKKHSQNLVRDSGDIFYHRNTEAPEMYETTTTAEYPGSESVSVSKSNEIIAQPFDNDQSQDFEATTDLDNVSSQEFLSKEQETYIDEDDMRLSDSLERESTVLEKPEDEDHAGGSRGSQNTGGGNMEESEGYGNADDDYHAQYSPNQDHDTQSSPEVDLTNYNEEFYDGDEGRSSQELLITSGYKENEEKNRVAEIATENGRDQSQPDEHTSVEGLVKIQHLSNFSDETTEISIEYETVEDSIESVSKNLEENEKSATMGTDEEEYKSDESTEGLVTTLNYYDSTKGSAVLGNRQGLNDGYSTEKVGIIHTRNRPSHRDNEYGDYSEESSTGYSTENSYMHEYRHYDEASVIRKTNSCSQQFMNGGQSTTDSSDLDSISQEDVNETNTHEEEIASIESQENYSRSKSKEEVMNTSDQINNEKHTLSEVQKDTSTNQYVRLQNPEITSITEPSETDDAADEVFQQGDTLQKQTTSESNEHDGNWADEDAGNRPESTTIEHAGNLEMKKETKEEMKSVEFVGGPHSTGEYCTKPPEVGDDIGYLGRLAPKNPNADIRSLGDLVNSDLYYIGDGVRLPLSITRLKDGSFALSISDKICEKRSKKKCPCCVPREGKILQEKHSEETSSLHRRDVTKGIEEEEFDDVEKTQHHNKRSTRSITMPVDEFAEKYNLILNLEDRVLDQHESSLMHNVIQRDEREQESEKDNDDLVQRLKSIKDLPDNEKTGVLLSTLEELIGTRQTKDLKEKRQNLKSREDEDEEDRDKDESQVLKFCYGYQKDNPILDRIEMIKKLQKKMYKCEHRYQQDCHDAITQKTDLLTMILYWLKDLASSKPNQTKN